MLLADVLTAVVGLISDIIPDFVVYCTAAVVVSLSAYSARRFLKAGR